MSLSHVSVCLYTLTDNRITGYLSSQKIKYVSVEKNTAPFGDGIIFIAINDRFRRVQQWRQRLQVFSWLLQRHLS